MISFVFTSSSPFSEHIPICSCFIRFYDRINSMLFKYPSSNFFCHSSMTLCTHLKWTQLISSVFLFSYHSNPSIFLVAAPVPILAFKIHAHPPFSTSPPLDIGVMQSDLFSDGCLHHVSHIYGFHSLSYIDTATFLAPIDVHWTCNPTMCFPLVSVFMHRILNQCTLTHTRFHIEQV